MGIPADAFKSSLLLSPIGVIHTSMQLKFDAPHQPQRGRSQRSTVELLAQQNFEKALEDLAGFDYIWLIWWFHRNSTWRPKVLPPRGSAGKRGVFATRAPHRPNPLGITAVKLLEISGRNLIVGDNDLVDGTPILDIKPYIPSIDAIPDARSGWLTAIEEKSAAAERFSIRKSELAALQLTWLNEHGVFIEERALAILSCDPSPNRTRRISRTAGSGFRMGCGAWRIFFSISDKEVLIERVAPGYPRQALESVSYDQIPFRQEQIAFNNIWRSSPE